MRRKKKILNLFSDEQMSNLDTVCVYVWFYLLLLTKHSFDYGTIRDQSGRKFNGNLYTEYQK